MSRHTTELPQLIESATLPPLPVSVVILTKNECTNIETCLRSVLSYSRDVVVVDDYSTDDTADRSRRLGARVLQHAFTSFAAQRNWAIDTAEFRNPWVLMLDADEEPPAEFWAELRRALAVSDNETSAFLICRQTIFMNRWLKWADTFPVWVGRIILRGRARFRDDGHGEKLELLAGVAHTINVPVLHHICSRGLSDWLHRHDRYAGREAQKELEHAAPILPTFTALFTFDAFQRRQALKLLSQQLPFRPFWRFFYQYVFRGGFLDRRAGFAYCCLMAFYEQLIVLKKWELQLNTVRRNGT